MPSIVALILYIIFVFLLLRLDHKQSKDVSVTLWIPTIWFLLNCTKPLGIWFVTGGVDMESGSPLDRLVLIIFLVLGLLILLKRQFNWSNAVKNNYWVLIILFYMLTSLLWSDMPYQSFKRWTKVLIAVVMTFVLITENNPIEAVKAVLRRYVYIIIPGSLLLVKYYPKFGVEFHHVEGYVMWIGASLQKNGLSTLCISAIFFLTWTLSLRFKNRDATVIWYQTYAEFFIVGIAIWLFMGPRHVLTNSSTSLVTLVIGLIMYLCLSSLKKRNIITSANTLTTITVFIIVIGTVTPFIGKIPFINVADTLGRSDTLTGRTDIWNYLIPMLKGHFFLGYGFGGFWTDEIREKTSSHAHNGYLDLILNIGILGHILFSFFLIISCRKTQRMMIQNFDWGSLWICFLFMAMVHNITESSIISFTGIWGAILLFMFNTSITSKSTNEKST